MFVLTDKLKKMYGGKCHNFVLLRLVNHWHKSAEHLHERGILVPRPHTMRACLCCNTFISVLPTKPWQDVLNDWIYASLHYRLFWKTATPISFKKYYKSVECFRFVTIIVNKRCENIGNSLSRSIYSRNYLGKM